jgi:hypothetical protein
MTLIPREAQVVFSVDVDRLRGSKMWSSVNEIRNDGQAKKDIDEFVQKTGFDPMTQLHSVTGGVPVGASDSHEVAIVFKGKFDEQKLLAYAREKSKEKGTEITSEPYAGKTIYGSKDKDEMQMTFLDPQTFVLAGKGWVRKVIDLSARKGESVAKNDVVQGLIKKTKPGQAVWAVGTLPPEKAKLPTGGEVKSLAGNLDFAQGLAVDVYAESPTPDGAKQLTSETQKQIDQAKQNPMLAMSGLGGIVDSVKLSTEGSSMHVAIAMNQQQVDELTNRVKGLMKMLGGMGGGMGMPGMAPPPPGTPPAGDSKLPKK